MATQTTHYSFNKPAINGDEDAWGGYLNGNWDTVSTLLGGVDNTEFQILNGATCSTAELNKLAGLTASTAQLNYNVVTTLGTSEASKVVTSDANNVVTFSGGITEDSVTITSSSNAATLNMRDGTNFVHDLTENVTYTFTNPASTGNVSAFTLKVIQGSTARTITWPSVKWPGGAAPTLTATNDAVDFFVFIYDGANWYGFTAGQALA